MKKHETNSFLVSKCFNHQYHRDQTFLGDHITRNHQTYSGDNFLGLKVRKFQNDFITNDKI